MAQRALVIGSQIEGLRGVDNDTRRMAAMLDARGFNIDLRIGAAATRAGILAGYDDLIAASTADDAAAIYYCGHGYHATIPEEGRPWQCIAPTDLRAGTVTDWRGITAWELSIKQAQLTAKTRNVTVILDCCHSAQLSRSDGLDGAIVRALPHPVHAGFDHHLAALRTTYGLAFDSVDPVGNPHAVRVVACGQSESAFEYPDAAGEYHGVFTDVLLDVLNQVGTAQVSWAAIIGAIRARVLRRFVMQRPDVEGPTRRRLFSLIEHDGQPSVSVTAVGEQFRLGAGELTGAAVGDIYGILTPGSIRGDQSLTRLEVIEVHGTTASARRIAGSEPLPGDAIAIPLRRRTPRWAVMIDAPEPALTIMQTALSASSTLRAALRGETAALATVHIADDTITIEASRGPFRPASFPAGLDRVLSQLADLGLAQRIRELEGEHGVRAAELAIELGTVRDGRPTRIADHGTVLGLRDRYYLGMERRAQRTLFVHVLNLTARGKVVLLTHFARAGVVLDQRAPSVILGQRPDGALAGVGLRWPDGLPSDGMPRLTEFVVIATLAPIDLAAFETQNLDSMRSDAKALERVLARLCDGLYRAEPGARPLDGFLVKRLSILLIPDRASSGDGAGESD